LFSRMKRAALLSVVFLVAYPALAEPPAQVAVSPPRVEMTLDGASGTESLHVMNLSDKSVRVKLSVAHWDLDDENQVRVIPPTEQSLDQWLIVNPLEATIGAKDQQTIRLAVRPRVAPSPGEHRAIIYIEQQPDTPDTRDGAPDQGSVSVRYRVGIAVYGNAGEIRRSGEVHDVVYRLEGKNLVVGVDVTSSGNAYVRTSGRFGVWPVGAYPGDERAAQILSGDDKTADLPKMSGLIPELPVLAGTRRTIEARTTRPTEPGNYVIAVAGRLADAPFTRTVDFRVD
jgi:P pilus assembly chaperone PapD